MFAYIIISRDTKNSKAVNILKTREKVRRSSKIINFQNTPVVHIIQQKKIRKTSDDSENGASHSQIGRRWAPLY